MQNNFFWPAKIIELYTPDLKQLGIYQMIESGKQSSSECFLLGSLSNTDWYRKKKSLTIVRHRTVNSTTTVVRGPLNKGGY
jgi:hypothetical protein